ncbi:MAG: GIY-YIG nuclease family protein [Gemmobacter sp.]
MKTVGRSLELFFIDGDPTGMLTAEIFNWTGHVLYAPRTRIREAIIRPEAAYTGVYILLGEVESKPRIYIGEAEDIAHRIRSHDVQKDWWDRAVLIVSSANTLNKAHVKYLESRLVEEAMDVGNAELDNRNTPTRSGLSEAATANMEAFLENVLLVLPALRVDVFLKRTRRSQQVVAAAVPGDPVFELVSKKHHLTATARLSDGEFVVLQGSDARASWEGTETANYRLLHAQLVESGVIRVDGDKATFAENYAFSSPSAAAATVLGRTSNGTIEWQVRGQLVSYKAWEAAQLKESAA